ncbi:glycosyltransferase family 4 protein [Halioxenophilus aromaticivorans]|uniref:Glycosyltransferase family 4 protein n=1 Tax=Halioxenophilus aromaticivorans TaxID=1306992 RepID=A0AAV3U256_9ALTE
MAKPPLRVVQVLPELNAGGVERGTVEFAQFLVAQGHQSTVISAGGRLVPELTAQGSEHIAFPVHRKSLASLFKVRSLRRLLMQLAPDIVHVRSRVPAWMVWLALRGMPHAQRPALVSTFHGLYSINAYSAIMGCGDAVIAISECVREYILNNYPKVDPAKISLVHRGVDTDQFNTQCRPSTDWLAQFDREFPGLRQRPVLLMPGRLSRWKGQLEFIDLMAQLRAQNIAATGLIVGDITPGKDDYLGELKAKVAALGLDEQVKFLGHRSDMAQLYAISTLVCNLSQRPEPFGRTVIEAMAMGTPVVAYNVGGPAESLALALPQGLVATGDGQALLAKVAEFIASPPVPKQVPEFTLQTQAQKTLAIYQRLLVQTGNLNSTGGTE